VSAKCIGQDGIFCRGFEDLPGPSADAIRLVPTRETLMASTNASGNSFREMARTGRNLSGCLSAKCADVARILKPTALAAPTNGQSFVVFMTSFNGRKEKSEYTG